MIKIEKKLLGFGKPLLAIVGCVHGGEKIGKKAIAELSKLKIKKGSLLTVIANPVAVKNNKRYIEKDLNRSFPGNKNGCYEEKLAFQLRKELSACDYVVDIHSTTTDTKSLVILSKYNGVIKKFIECFNPKRVALINKETGKNSLIHHVKCGISFEYGSEGSRTALNEIVKDIKIIMDKLGMINYPHKNKNNTEFFKITNLIEKKSDMRVNPEINNFNLIKKGRLIAQNENNKIIAEKDFYPVLFGEKNYKDIFGFMAEKTDKFFK